jgi:hypothetical protein
MAATPQTVSNYAALLKESYPDRKIEVTGYRDRPLLAMMPKETGWHGDDLIIPVITEGHTGASNTFANSQTRSRPSTSAAFKNQHHEVFASPRINARLMRQSKHPSGAIQSSIITEFDSAFETVWNKLAVQLYRKGTGSIGRVGSTSTTTLTLSEKADIVNFQLGMTIDSDDVDGSGTVDGGQTLITGIDEDAGTLTAAANWTAGGHFSDNDFLFPDGDYGAGSSRLAIMGLGAGAPTTSTTGWIPSTAPSSGDSHLGIDRSTHGIRAYASRFAAVAGTHTISTAFQKGAARLRTRQGRADTIMMNPLDFNEFTDELGAKVVYERRPAIDSEGNEVGQVGFDGIVIHTPAGRMTVFDDPFCPKGHAYILNLDDFLLASSGPTVGFENEDGPDFLRVGDSNDYEARIVFYGDTALYEPRNQVYVDLSAIVAAT